MTDRNRTYQNGRVSTHSDVQCGSANRQISFSGHIANKFRRPTILQLNIEGLTASKMNVLHHLAMQSEALDVGLITPLPASDSGNSAVWGSKRINPRPQSCLCLTCSGYPSNDDDDDDEDAHNGIRCI